MKSSEKTELLGTWNIPCLCEANLTATYVAADSADLGKKCKTFSYRTYPETQESVELSSISLSIQS